MTTTWSPMLTAVVSTTPASRIVPAPNSEPSGTSTLGWTTVANRSRLIPTSARRLTIASRAVPRPAQTSRAAKGRVAATSTPPSTRTPSTSVPCRAGESSRIPITSYRPCARTRASTSRASPLAATSRRSPPDIALPARSSGAQRVDDPRLVRLGELVVHRQDERRVGQVLGHGQRPVSGACVGRLAVGRHDAAARGDVGGREVREQTLTVERELGEHLDPVRLEVARPPGGVLDRAQARDVGDLLAVCRIDLTATQQDLGQLAELHDPDGGLQVCHPVVVADLEVLL